MKKNEKSESVDPVPITEPNDPKKIHELFNLPIEPGKTFDDQKKLLFGEPPAARESVMDLRRAFGPSSDEA